MPTSGANAIDGIQADLACPQCQYNLRGLRGEVVSCPECGAVCDVAKLIATRWEKPWYTAPGYARMAMPAGIMLAGVILDQIIWVFALDHPQWQAGLELGMAAMALTTLLAWALALWWVVRWFAFPLGLRITLLAHLLILGYATSFVVILACLFRILFEIYMGGWALGVLRLAVCTAAGSTCVYFCRRGERYIAEQCIRRYVRQHTVGRIES